MIRRVIAWILLAGFLLLLGDIITCHKFTNGNFSKFAVVTYIIVVLGFILTNNLKKQTKDEKPENDFKKENELEDKNIKE